MSNLFLHSSDNVFSISSLFFPSDVYCLDVESFIESSESGDNCAISICTFIEHHTSYKLALIDSRLEGLISSDLFHSRLSLLNDIYSFVNLRA